MIAHTRILFLGGTQASVEAELSAMISAGWTIQPTDITISGYVVQFTGLATKVEKSKASKRSATTNA